MSVEIVLLQNMVLDFADSEDTGEAMLGQLLNTHTCDLDGEEFVIAIREILDGLRTVVDRFDEEWTIIQ